MNEDEDEIIGIEEPEASAPIAVPVIVVPVAVERDLPQVKLEVFLQVSKYKPFQTGGFRHWATSRKVLARTMPEWQRLWKEFQERPVR